MYHIGKQRSWDSDPLPARFRNLSSATVHEAMGRRNALDPHIKPIFPGMRLCGRAVTVACPPGDNLMLAKAISMAPRGSVLVVDAGDTHDAGGFGEILAVECQVRGVAGIVTSGAVRDSRKLIEMGFPAFSWTISICGTTKTGLGSINLPVRCGGVLIHPGDLILADEDGVTSVPAEEAEAVLEKALAREQEEQALIEKLRAGASFSQLKNYDEILASLGCVYENSPGK